MNNPYLAQRQGLIFAAAMLMSTFMPFITVMFFSASLWNVVSFVSMAARYSSEVPSGVRTALWLYYLLYAVPIAAGGLIVRELQGLAGQTLRLAVGFIGLIGPFAVIALSSALIGASVPDRPSSGEPGSSEIMWQMMSNLGFGWMLLILASAGLIAVGFGWAPFGTPPGGDGDTRP